jgi:hypothetical protein
MNDDDDPPDDVDPIIGHGARLTARLTSASG